MHFHNEDALSCHQACRHFPEDRHGRLPLDGNVMLTERDEFIYDEMITHVPMAVHKEARDILVIGAGDGGVVRELTRYDRVRKMYVTICRRPFQTVTVHSVHSNFKHAPAHLTVIYPDLPDLSCCILLPWHIQCNPGFPG